ncbi:MAG: polysaccharide biosynthesis/export family protein [Acidobacteriota bacterium]|nr:polysaccharide biosynthesis/export family protein [Acidobacteriota bacterium]
MALAVIASALAPNAPSQEKFSTRGSTYRLHPGDTIEIHYTYTPEHDQTATLQPDGFVTLKLGGSMKVSELTVEETAAVVKKAAAVRLNEPEVAVLLKDYIKPHIVIAGEVMKPGTYDLHGRVTLIEALSWSGGMKDTSKQTRVLLVRRSNPEMASVRVIDVKSLMTANNVHEDIELNPDDMLIIPKNMLGRIEPYVRIASQGMTALYGVSILK